MAEKHKATSLWVRRQISGCARLFSGGIHTPLSSDEESGCSDEGCPGLPRYEPHLQGTSIEKIGVTSCCVQSGPECEAEVWVLRRWYHDSCILDESVCDAEVGSEELCIVKSSGAMCAYPRETGQIFVKNCRNPVNGLKCCHCLTHSGDPDCDPSFCCLEPVGWWEEPEKNPLMGDVACTCPDLCCPRGGD